MPPEVELSSIVLQVLLNATYLPQPDVVPRLLPTYPGRRTARLAAVWGNRGSSSGPACPSAAIDMNDDDSLHREGLCAALRTSEMAFPQRVGRSTTGQHLDRSSMADLPGDMACASCPTAWAISVLCLELTRRWTLSTDHTPPTSSLASKHTTSRVDCTFGRPKASSTCLSCATPADPAPMSPTRTVSLMIAQQTGKTSCTR